MLIRKLVLENTKSYVNATFEFTPGTNAIVGANGAGKSTILEAIGFALFDTLNYRHADFVREGAKTATVTVTIFSGLDERAYDVTRRCGGSTQYYVFDPVLNGKVCEGKSDVLAFLKEHMQVDPTADLPALFNDAVGVPQGTLTAAFLQTASTRKKAFDTLLQVEEYKAAADKLREPVRLLREQIVELDLALKEAETRLERLPELKSVVAQREKTLKQLAKDQTRCQARWTTIKEQIDAQSTLQQEIRTARERSRELSQQLQSLVREIEGAEQAVSEADRSKKLVQTHEAGYRQYLEAQQDQAKLNQKQRERQQFETEQSQLQQVLAAVQAAEKMQQQELDKAQKAAQLADDLTSAVQRQEILEEKRAQLERKELQLEELRQSLPQLQQRCDQIQTRAQQLEKQLSKQEALSLRRQQLTTATQEQQTALSRMSHAMGQYQVEAESLKDQISRLSDANNASCPVCEQPLTAEHRQTLMQRNETRLGELRLAYADQRSKEEKARIQIEEQQATLSQLDRELQALPRPEEVKAVAGELADVQEQIERQQRQIGALEESLPQLRQTKDELAELKDPRQRQAIANEAADKREEIEMALCDSRKKRRCTETKLEELSQRLRGFAAVDEALVQVAATLNREQSAYQTVLAHQQTADTLQKRRSGLTALQNEQNRLAQEEQHLTRQMRALAAQFDEEAYNALQQSADELQRELVSLQAQEKLLRGDQQRDEQEVTRLHSLQEKQKRLTAKRNKLARHLEALETIRSHLRRAGPYITRTLIQQVSSGANQIFGDLMQDYSRHLNWDEEYGISLEVEGRQRQFAQLSGGEQMSAALAVRLALLREMSNIEIAFFDEPTTNLDESRRESLARQILDIRGFQQLFVISHDDTFEQSTENVIRIGSGPA